MISGRGLGLTGGTLDKLESIPGYRTDLSLARLADGVDHRVLDYWANRPARTGRPQALCSARRDRDGELDPIDRRLHSVEETERGLDALVLDVKFGAGAFMADFDQAKSLAEALVSVSEKNGVSCSALITDMNQPIGRCIGNALEIEESIEVLRGEGPADTWELTQALAVRMLRLAGEARHDDEAIEAVQAVVDSALARLAVILPRG